MNDQFQLSDEQKNKAIEAIRVFFENERDESIGDLAAMLVLDFFSEELGAVYYNKGVEDARRYMSDKLDDLYSLEK